jgi:hypothetical protein
MADQARPRRIVMLARVLCLVAVVAVLTSTALGTDRFYLDSSGVSPSGRYRIDAQSPDNAGPRRRPFAANFTYTLTDTTTGKVVWERKQPMGREKGSTWAFPQEPSPTVVFVNDAGLVAARSAHDTLILLDPSDGRKRAEAAILEAFPAEQKNQFVTQSTAGPIWCRDSDWFFLEVPGRSAASVYFVVRPYWHHRLVVDARTGKHVELGEYAAAASAEQLAGADPSVRTLMQAIMEEEARRALAVLSGAVEAIQTDPDSAARRVRVALQTAGLLKLCEAEAPIRALEAALGHDDRSRLWLSRKVRETLRALGKVPEPGCGVLLYPMVKKDLYITHDQERPYRSVVPIEQRLANAEKIAAGMTIEEVAELIGCPDAEVYDRTRGYDYDIDATEPYTLRVHYDMATQTVVEVRKITPLAFLHEPARMRGH